jgi:hypothetical protein
VGSCLDGLAIAELAALRAEVASLRAEVARLQAELARRTPRPRNTERDAAIRRLRAEGWRHKALAKRFGTTEGAIRQVCRRGNKNVTEADVRLPGDRPRNHDA